jgi:hypothetical protein
VTTSQHSVIAQKTSMFINNTIKASSDRVLLFGLFVCSYGPSRSGVNVNTSIIAWNWVGRWIKLSRRTIWFYMRSLCLGKRLRRVGNMSRTWRQGTPILFWLKILLEWHNLEHYPGIYLVELRQTTQNVINWPVSA